MYLFYFQGKYAGNAVGFRISSLTKLTDTRANKPRVTLLHYVVNEAEKKHSNAIAFVDELFPDLNHLSRCVGQKLFFSDLSFC